MDTTIEICSKTASTKSPIVQENQGIDKTQNFEIGQQEYFPKKFEIGQKLKVIRFSTHQYLRLH